MVIVKPEEILDLIKKLDCPDCNGKGYKTCDCSGHMCDGTTECWTCNKSGKILNDFGQKLKDYLKS